MLKATEPLIARPSLTGGCLGDDIASAPGCNDPFGLDEINRTRRIMPGLREGPHGAVPPAFTTARLRATVRPGLHGA